jgi:DNA (cytosine-5)-methyltransferase 1
MAPKAISLFTGAGGLDFGFDAAGFQIAVALDMDPVAAQSFKASRPGVPYLVGDVSDTPSDEILRVAGLKEGEASVLIGGPPCQPFSKAGYWVRGDSGRLEDPRARTLQEYLRVVRDTLPEVILLENVHGIAYTGKEEGLSFIFAELERINKERGASYEPAWAVLNAADYGVPQLRYRFFLVAHREGKRFEFPKPTHGPKGTITGEYVTSWDAIGDIAIGPEEEKSLAVRGKWADLLPSIPEGWNYLWHTDRGGGLPIFGWRTRYWNFLLKLAKARPSWTITANPGPSIGPFHWRNRRLSIEELIALQTFPKDAKVRGSYRGAQRQIGNAVPSLLAEILARQILATFFGRTFSEPPRLTVRLKRPIPDPEPVGDVPERYLALVRERPPHPGTGKGPRARATAPVVAQELFPGSAAE